MIRVVSRNARFRKKIRGKWKNPLLPKVLGLFWPYDSKLCFVLYAYMCLLCPQNWARAPQPRCPLPKWSGGLEV